MIRIWNYFFYSTWKTQISLGRIIIEKPLMSAFNKIPILKKNWEKNNKYYYSYMHSKEHGMNLGFAFSSMFLTTMVIYTSISLFLVKLLDIEVGELLIYFFIAIVVFSYLTNELLIYRTDTYKKYFEEFEKINNKSRIYLSAVLFHLAVIGFGILSIHFTVGFNI